MAERLLSFGAVAPLGGRIAIGHLRIRSVDRLAQHSEFRGNRKSLRHGADVQLLHDALAMRLHGPLRGPKVVGDLLVEPPANDQGKNRALQASGAVKAAQSPMPYGPHSAGTSTARCRLWAEPPIALGGSRSTPRPSSSPHRD